jgi:16S rRNA (guanine527-N7)-methyltransferase
MPNAVFTLIERMGKRAGFLRDAVAMLGLPNVLVEEAEMEKLAMAVENRFDLIVFRAFKPLDSALLKGLFAILKPSGILAAYKGRRQAIDEEMSGLQNVSWEAIPLEVPFLAEERHLVLIKR